ncbi:MAG: prepilin-type N-terminal cleavage/methylation domain-containing protein [Thermoleophilia bacterium]
MFEKLCKRMKGEGGFTLIELLVVIIIIAILAAIAIPTFLGQRQKAQDAAAKSLVRNAMTAVESQYVDTRAFATATAAPAAALIEPAITFTQGGGTVTASTITAAAATANDAVNYAGNGAAGATTQDYIISTASESGNLFGVWVQKVGGTPGTIFMKSIGGTISSGW